jgi:hypothetical protein
MKVILILLSIILSIKTSLQNLSVITPSTLRDSITKLTKGGVGEIKTRYGKFGEIPYGKSITGYAYSMFPYKQEANDWCEPDIFAYIPDQFSNEESYSPIVIANSLNCPFTQKAINAQRAKGVALIIISSDNFFAESENIDDTDGENITIPTLIVNSQAGSILTDYLKTDNQYKVVLSMSFKTVIEGDKINMQMFFRSDQVKALHFFKEFEQYKNKFGSRLIFTPVYKYLECLFCQSSDSLSEEPEDACFKDGQYCGGYSTDLNVNNNRLVLLENLRQKCIFNSYPLDVYWTYMMRFSEVCSDLNLPLFTKSCSKDIMGIIGVDSTIVENCMTKALTDPKSTVLSADKSQFEGKRIRRYPTIMFNGIKYKGSWLAQHVFHSVCEGFLSDHSVCKKDTTAEITADVEESSELSGFGIALIVFIVIFTMIIIVLCYRRIVNKTIDETIEDRIYKQTKDSVGNYSKMDKSGILA